MADWLRRPFRSTTTRFALLAFAFQLPITGGVLFFSNQRAQQAIATEQQQWVAELRRELLLEHAERGVRGLAEAIDQRLSSVRGDLAVLLLIDKTGAPMAGNLDAWPTVLPDQTPWRTVDLYRRGAERPEPIGVSTLLLPDGARLLTGQVISNGVRVEQINREAMMAALVIGALLTLLSALVLGRLLSRQIDGIVRTAESVSAGALGNRVRVDGSGDAFDALGGAINTMLDRIETLVSELRLMTDGLAHDLKSPVTRLKSVLERAIAETDDPQAGAALEKVAREADALLAMLSTALLISRTHAGIGRERRTRVDARLLLDDLAEIYGPLAEDHGFALAVDAPVGMTIDLNRELISQSLGNLIENALKYAEGGRAIRLSARAVAGQFELAVADDGPGIAEARRQDARSRFGRLDPARHIPGSGLGLSLVEAVAHLHDGAFALEDNQPGLRAVLRLSG